MDALSEILTLKTNALEYLSAALCGFVAHGVHTLMRKVAVIQVKIKMIREVQRDLENRIRKLES